MSFPPPQDGSLHLFFSEDDLLITLSSLVLTYRSVDRARKILVRSRMETRAEWKVFLESVLLEMRDGQWGKAVEEARSALKIHSGTGRYVIVTAPRKKGLLYTY